jgi:hypothetical protein
MWPESLDPNLYDKGSCHPHLPQGCCYVGSFGGCPSGLGETGGANVFFFCCSSSSFAQSWPTSSDSLFGSISVEALAAISRQLGAGERFLGAPTWDMRQALLSRTSTDNHDLTAVWEYAQAPKCAKTLAGQPLWAVVSVALLFWAGRQWVCVV